jgi:hypothetical protein
MTRVHVVVEGESEEAFLRGMVTPHLAARSVWLYPRRVLRGGGGCGGGRSWQPWQTQLESLLKRDRDPALRVTTMLDLYAIPKDTPGWTPPGEQAGPRRAEQIVAALRAALPDRRFVPYVQVHELETLLYADLDVLARLAPDTLGDGLAALVRDTSALDPETIDDAPTSAPSRRILRCAPASSGSRRRTVSLRPKAYAPA